MASSGIVDVAVTYNDAAEKILVDNGDVVDRVYGFRVSHSIHLFPFSFADRTASGPLLSRRASVEPCKAPREGRHLHDVQQDCDFR